MSSVLCDHCTAVCCHYVALPIDQPENKRDFDDIRWYLMHDGVIVFVEEGDWYVQFRTTCRNLRSDFKCGVYDTRPQICREYKAQDCDYSGEEYSYDHLFTDPDSLTDYGREFLAKQRSAKRRKNARRKKRLVKPGTTKRLVG